MVRLAGHPLKISICDSVTSEKTAAKCGDAETPQAVQGELGTELGERRGNGMIKDLYPDSSRIRTGRNRLNGR